MLIPPLSGRILNHYHSLLNYSKTRDTLVLPHSYHAPSIACYLGESENGSSCRRWCLDTKLAGHDSDDVMISILMPLKSLVTVSR
jgi:hypothetical protein